jgi:hypothetical protein
MQNANGNNRSTIHVGLVAIFKNKNRILLLKKEEESEEECFG